MQKPILSIVIAVYNSASKAGNVIVDCLDSIFCQNIEEETLEVVCVNDGSTDNTLEVLENYQKEHKNVVVISQENGGGFAAKNTGIDHVQGSYLWMINSDDCIKNGSLAAIIEVLQKEKPDLIKVPLMHIPEDKFQMEKVFSQQTFSFRVNDGSLNPPSDDVTSIMRTDIIHSQNIRFIPNTHYHSDRLFGVQYFLRVDPTLIFLSNETVYLRRQRSVSETGKVKTSLQARNRYVSDSVLMAEEYSQIIQNKKIENPQLFDFIQSQRWFFTEVAIVSIPSSDFDKDEVFGRLERCGAYPYPFLMENVKKAPGMKNKILVFFKCFFRFKPIYNIFYSVQKRKNK